MWSLNCDWEEWKLNVAVLKTYSSIQKLKVVQDCAVNRLFPLLFSPPPSFHHYSDCGILTAERGTTWWSMTAVTIHTTERLGEKCNFPSSVELQKKGEEKEWTRQNYLPATTRACGNYYNDVSESRHSQCRDHTGADQKIKISGGTQGGHSHLIKAC